MQNSRAALVASGCPVASYDRRKHNEAAVCQTREDRGFLVYSIGADFTDDGGKEKPRDAKDTDHYDITFSVER
jgi:hypothetical protein